MVTKTNMTRRQKTWKNLTMDTLEKLALASTRGDGKGQDKLCRRTWLPTGRYGRCISDHVYVFIHSIVEGVHSLSFNVQQEVMMRNHMTATLQDKLLNNDIATGHTGDILSTFITLEKVRRQWTWHYSPYSALILIRALWVLNRFNDSSWSCL